jgi:predicted aldo/keto reductase-like oxidoreductase
MQGLGVLDWAEKMMAEGCVGHLGFSFHDELPVFKSIVDAYDNWTLCQIQYNFMDVDNQAGRSGLEYATYKELAVVVMEPLRGGLLASAPEPVAKVWATEPRKASPVEWSLLWILNQPEVSLALSGMSTMEQVEQNIEIAGRSGPGILTRDELALIYRVREAYRDIIPIPCTKCGYCIPCPSGVEIPRIFDVYNEAAMYNSRRMGWFRYSGPMGLKEEERADRCTECGDCLEACPQKIEIPDWLKKAHEWLSEEE